MIRRVLAIGIAVVLAVVGTVIVLGYVSAADARALAGKKAVTVVVAKARIPAGTSGARIRASGLTEQVRMPAETLPPGALQALDEELDELVVTSDVQGSQLLLRGMFGDSVKSTGGLAIPDGKLAVSVQLRVPEQVAGFVRPGSTIAVFDTFTMVDGRHRVPNGEVLGRAKDDVHATRLLLPRVEVLAVGAYGEAGTRTSNGGATRTSSDRSSRSGQAAPTVLVTVAVTQSEAEKLVHVARTGNLYLALVTESSEVRPGAGVDNRSLFK